MEPNYTYIPSPNFINNLTFNYVETYSLQRGKDFEEKRKIEILEYDKLKVRNEKRDNLTATEKERLNQLNKLLGFTQYLLNDEKQFHPSSKKINTFKFDNPIVERLKDILKTDVIEIPSWMCAPVYRDALVFYDKDSEIITTLNICLSCEYMETTKFNHIEADCKTYDLLKQFFIDIGHEVKNDY
jgi:hypothetical protein